MYSFHRLLISWIVIWIGFTNSAVGSYSSSMDTLGPDLIHIQAYGQQAMFPVIPSCEFPTGFNLVKGAYPVVGDQLNLSISGFSNADSINDFSIGFFLSDDSNYSIDDTLLFQKVVSDTSVIFRPNFVFEQEQLIQDFIDSSWQLLDTSINQYNRLFETPVQLFVDSANILVEGLETIDLTQFADGTYYLIEVIDLYNEVVESDETNNIFIQEIPLSITAFEPELCGCPSIINDNNEGEWILLDNDEENDPYTVYNGEVVYNAILDYYSTRCSYRRVEDGITFFSEVIDLVDVRWLEGDVGNNRIGLVNLCNPDSFDLARYTFPDSDKAIVYEYSSVGDEGSTFAPEVIDGVIDQLLSCTINRAGDISNYCIECDDSIDHDTVPDIAFFDANPQFLIDGFIGT